MSSRASLKGKGASIFFGDEDAAQDIASQPTDRQAETAVRARPGARASRHRGTQPSRSEPGRQRAIEPVTEQSFFDSLKLPDTLRRRLRTMSREEHPFHTSVRLSRDEMSALRDLCYELDAKMGIAINRNDVMRLALRLLLEDYAQRKKESLLVQVLEEEDQY